MELMSRDRSPMCNMRPPSLLEPSMQRQLTHFNLITHGFGQPTFNAVLNCVQSIFTEMIKSADKAGSVGSVGGLCANGPSATMVQGSLSAPCSNSLMNSCPNSFPVQQLSSHSHSHSGPNSANLIANPLDSI